MTLARNIGCRVLLRRAERECRQLALALVHLRQLLRVCHCQSLAVAHSFRRGSVEQHSRLRPAIRSYRAKFSITIVHQGHDIIVHRGISINVIKFVLAPHVLRGCFDVVPKDGHILRMIRARLLVQHAEVVANLVSRHAHGVAATPEMAD